MDVLDLIIIGAGPSGIACALEARKQNLSYMILEKGVLVNSIYNFPTNMIFFSTSKKLEIGNIPFISHNEKATRKEALEYYRRLVLSHDLNIKYKTKVNTIDTKKDLFSINGDMSLMAKNIVVATGFYDNYRPLGIPGENLSKVKHYYDDAHLYIGMKVLVIGAANSACDVALETWQKGAEVSMAVRGESLYEKVKYWILPNIKNRIKEGSIKAYFNTTVKEIKESSVILLSESGELEIENDYVLAMTGYLPEFSMLRKFGIEIDPENSNKPNIDPDTLMTNVNNVYVAGVVVSGSSTSELFIENTRHHGSVIVNNIVKKNTYTTLL